MLVDNISLYISPNFGLDITSTTTTRQSSQVVVIQVRLVIVTLNNNHHYNWIIISFFGIFFLHCKTFIIIYLRSSKNWSNNCCWWLVIFVVLLLLFIKHLPNNNMDWNGRFISIGSFYYLSIFKTQEKHIYSPLYLLLKNTGILPFYHHHHHHCCQYTPSICRYLLLYGRCVCVCVGFNHLFLPYTSLWSLAFCLIFCWTHHENNRWLLAVVVVVVVPYNNGIIYGLKIFHIWMLYVSEENWRKWPSSMKKKHLTTSMTSWFFLF